MSEYEYCVHVHIHRGFWGNNLDYNCKLLLSFHQFPRCQRQTTTPLAAFKTEQTTKLGNYISQVFLSVVVSVFVIAVYQPRNTHVTLPVQWSHSSTNHELSSSIILHFPYKHLLWCKAFAVSACIKTVSYKGCGAKLTSQAPWASRSNFIREKLQGALARMIHVHSHHRKTANRVVIKLESNATI